VKVKLSEVDLDRLCGLVVRVPGYRPRETGFVRIIEELLE
jgi:hypothetical protein